MSKSTHMVKSAICSDASFSENLDLEGVPSAFTYGIRIEQAYAERMFDEFPNRTIPDLTWSRVPAAAIDDASLRVLDWRVLAFRALWPRASQRKIADLLGLRQPKISDAHQRLQRLGYLQPAHSSCITRDGRLLPKPRYRGDKSVFGGCEYKVRGTKRHWVRMPLAAVQQLTLRKGSIRLIACIGQQVDASGVAVVRPNVDKRRISASWEQYVALIDYFVRTNLIEVVGLPVREDAPAEDNPFERHERAWYRNGVDADKLGLAVNFAPVKWG